MGLLKLVGANLPEGVIISQNGEMMEYHPVDDVARLNQSLTSLLKRPEAVVDIRARMNSESRAFIDWLQAHCTPGIIRDFTHDGLRDLLLQRHEMCIGFLTWQWFGFSGKYVFDDILNEIFIRNGVDPTEGLRVVYGHERSVHAQKEDLAVKEIALRKQNGEDVAALLDTHLNEYRGLYMYDEAYEPMTRENLDARVEEYVTNSGLGADIASAENRLVENKKEFSALLQRFNNNAADSLYIQFAHEYSEFMEVRNTYKGFAALNSRDLFREIGNRLGLALTETLAFNDYELADLLLRPDYDSKAEALLRLNHSVFTYDHHTWQRLDGQRAQEVEEMLQPKKATEIKGNPAFKAPPVRGIVRVINSVADMPKLQAGDILVSSMTRPEFIMSIQLAAAIVTDEGGTLCHAAIVSREMKKPCVIGTKIATQIFKDGDMVEVDAEKGIVRKI